MRTESNGIEVCAPGNVTYTYTNAQTEMLRIHINISHFTHYTYTQGGWKFFLSLFKLLQVSFSSTPEASASTLLVHFVQLNQMTQSQHRGISFYYEQQFK
jgi:hypothetical protein